MPLYDFGLTSQIEYSKNTQKLFRKVETQDTSRFYAVALPRLENRARSLSNTLF
jgi:hypothetical protein